MLLNRPPQIVMIFFMGFGLGLGLHFVVPAFWPWGESHHWNEDVISKEVMLLTRFSDLEVPCKELGKAGVWLQTHQHAYVIWSKLNPAKPTGKNTGLGFWVSKLIVDTDMSVAQEPDPIFCKL